MSRKKHGKDRKLKIYNEIRRLPVHMPELDQACDDSKIEPGIPSVRLIYTTSIRITFCEDLNTDQINQVVSKGNDPCDDVDHFLTDSLKKASAQVSEPV